jgi:tellurite resistance-related uncharacterized protein
MAEVTMTSATPEGGSEPILGKFKTQADLATAYQELEKKLSAQGKTMEVEGESVTSTPIPDNTEIVEAVYGEGITSALTAAGLDTATVSAEYESEAGLSEDTKTKLYNTFGKSVVDNYFAGIDAQKTTASAETTAAEQEVLSLFGGQENWSQVSQWAVTGSPELSEAFNDALDSGNTRYLKTAAMALKSAYENTQGTLSPVSVLKGQVPAAGVSNGYNSKHEMMTDIQSKQYSQDPAFRDQVALRIKASAGFDYR